MDFQELLLIAFRATIVYLAALLVVRILGKREIGSVGAFDLIVSLIIGESVDEAIYGDVSMLKFFVLIATIAAWHLVNSWATYKSKKLDQLLESQPTVLVEHGKIQEEALASQRINEEELYSQLRLNGFEDLQEVKKATLEPSGHVSVLQEDWAKPVQKRDLIRSQSEG